MAVRQRRLPGEEIERRGQELYEGKLRALLQPGNDGRILCIDVESGDYALGDDTLKVSQVLIDKNPDAQIWCLRIGHVAVDKFGGGDTRERR